MATEPNNCACGAQPTIKQIHEWPAQYRVACECGVSAIGPYYGSDDRLYRHSAARKAAVKAWNKGNFETKEEQ